MSIRGDWSYCQPTLGVHGINYTFHNMTIETGIQAEA